MRVAYLGPAGTYSEEALRASAPPGAEEVPYPTIYDAVMAVHDGAADRAVVPIENALEGGVGITLDTLALDTRDVRIAAEVVHPIHHCLIGCRPLAPGEITRVVSHPQATAQCARFLRQTLPRAEHVNAASTAEAVLSLRESGDTAAALGSRLAAEAAVPPAGAAAKTSIVFWGGGDQAPGWLVDVLGELASRGVNLTRIESRPRRIRLGHYMFFADLEGAADSAPVSDALKALGEHVEEVRVLGSYSSFTG